jgi:hypothetical protein
MVTNFTNTASCSDTLQAPPSQSYLHLKAVTEENAICCFIFSWGVMIQICLNVKAIYIHIMSSLKKNDAPPYYSNSVFLYCRVESPTITGMYLARGSLI